MKKACIIFVLSLLSSHLFAQDVEIGIQFNPNLSYNRAILKDGNNDDLVNRDYSAEGMKLKFSAGPVVDILLSPNIAVSTGAFFATKGVKYKATFTDQNDQFLSDAYYEVDLQYIQVPIGLKLFTGEITSNMKLYFELGGLLDVKIAEKYNEDTEYKGELGNLSSKDIDKTFAKLIDTEIHLSVGTEFEVGSNKAFFGISYNRGLINVLHKDFQTFTDKKNAKINNDIIGLVLGFKF